MKIKNMLKLGWVACWGRIGGVRGAYDEHKTVITIMRGHSKRKSTWGRYTSAALARMEVTDFPQRYVETYLDIDKSGYLVIRVKNPNFITLGRVRVRLSYKAPGSRLKVKYQPLDRPLLQGQSVRVHMNIGPIVNRMELNRFTVEAVGAVPLD